MARKYEKGNGALSSLRTLLHSIAPLSLSNAVELFFEQTDPEMKGT